MMPVPPPLIFEPGTAVSATPLNVTDVTLASAVVVSSTATPTTTMRSLPPPRVCDHESEVRPVLVVAARLAASNEIAAEAGSDAASRPTPQRAPSPPARRRERGAEFCIGLLLFITESGPAREQPCQPIGLTI